MAKSKSSWFSILPPAPKAKSWTNPKSAIPGYTPQRKRTQIAPPEIAPRKSFEAGTMTGKRLPGRTRAGSKASFVKSATLSQRQSMADIVRKVSDIIRNLRTASTEAIRDALTPVFEKSQLYVPKLTGTLADSGDLEIYQSSANRTMGIIHYGDTKAWYAALVHEYTWLNHRDPERSKYLQAALEEEFDQFLSRLAVSYALDVVYPS